MERSVNENKIIEMFFNAQKSKSYTNLLQEKALGYCKKCCNKKDVTLSLA